MTNYNKLLKILKNKGLLTDTQIKEILDIQNKCGKKVGSILDSLGYVPKEEILKALSEQTGVPYVNLNKVNIKPEINTLISDEICEKYKIVPFDMVGNTIKVACGNVADLTIKNEIEFIVGKKIEFYIELEKYIDQAIQNRIGKKELQKYLRQDYFKDIQEESEERKIPVLDLTTINVTKDEAPIINLLNNLLDIAIRDNATDIHIEPYKDHCRIRMRIDGILQEIINLPAKIKSPLISRCKLIARMDIANKLMPQDGKIFITIKNKLVDVRVSTLPTLYGEKVALRLLVKEKYLLDMEKLGMNEDHLKIIDSSINKSTGLIVVTGATSMGKSTTLYAILNKLNENHKHVLTVEDPIEYDILGINQSQINEATGMTYNRIIRTFLRQDPDIIMVGEIRDRETALGTMQCSLTGHLTLSTLHTNNAIGTIDRFFNMGIERFLITSTMELAIAQRLIRTICPNCKTENNEYTEEFLINFGFNKDELNSFIPMKGRGCEKCNGTGFKGRTGIFEMVRFDKELKKALLQNKIIEELEEIARKEQGMKTLKDHAMEKIKQGKTTVEEVLRIL
jgi:type IV pilus assembly protein PilB